MGAAARGPWDETLRAHHSDDLAHGRWHPVPRPGRRRADDPAPDRGHGRADCLGVPRDASGGEGHPAPGLLDRPHRDRGDAALGRHQLLHHQVLVTSFQGSRGTRPEGIALTELIRSDAPRRSAMASLALGGLVVGVVWFSVLTVVIALQVLGGHEDGQADSYMAVFLGMVFF